MSETFHKGLAHRHYVSVNKIMLIPIYLFQGSHKSSVQKTEILNNKHTFRQSIRLHRHHHRKITLCATYKIAPVISQKLICYFNLPLKRSLRNCLFEQLFKVSRHFVWTFSWVRIRGMDLNKIQRCLASIWRCCVTIPTGFNYTGIVGTGI